MVKPGWSFTWMAQLGLPDKELDILRYHISFVGSSFFRTYVSPEMCRKSINPIPLWKKKTALRNHGLFGARSLHRWLEPSTMRVFHFAGMGMSQQTTHVKAIDDCWSTAENWYIYIYIYICWAKAAYLGVPDFDPHPTCLKVGLAGNLYHSNCNSVGRPIGQTRWGHQIWNSVEQQPFQTWLSDWVHDRIEADSPCWDELGKQDLNDQMGWQASLGCNNVICVCGLS